MKMGDKRPPKKEKKKKKSEKKRITPVSVLPLDKLKNTN
jgi:hypothetical protein